MRRIRRIAVTPVITLAAYVAKDAVGGLLTFQITPANLDGLLRGVLFTDAEAQSEQYTLYVYDKLPSTVADADEYVPTIADLNKLASTIVVATADWTEFNSLDWVLIGGYEDTQMQIPVHSPTGALYVYLVATDTPDYAAADDLVVTLAVEVF